MGSQKLFCTPYDAKFWGSIVGTPTTLDEGPIAASESPLPDLALPELTDDFSWKPAPPLTRPPTLRKSQKLRGPPPPTTKGKGRRRRKVKTRQQLVKRPSPLQPKVRNKTRTVVKLQKKLVNKAFIPPP